MGAEQGPRFSHETVLLCEAVEWIVTDPSGVYVDGTAGGGGHSLAIAGKLSAGGRLVATDIDPQAVKATAERLQSYPNAAVHCRSYADIGALLRELGIDKIDGFLIDVGVSSYQLDAAGRGFSYHSSEPLDMRMGEAGPTAADLLRDLGAAELAAIFRDYGEERYAAKIANAIAREREREPILRADQLAALVASCYPAALRRGGNPSRQVFQALRIAVNGEFQNIEAGIRAAFEALRAGGRLGVISFHSLEDRLVKNIFKEFLTGCICPPDFPVCVCHRAPRAALVTRKPVVPSAEEIAHNRRSRSAKLRVIQKNQD